MMWLKITQVSGQSQRIGEKAAYPNELGECKEYEPQNMSSELPGSESMPQSGNAGEQLTEPVLNDVLGNEL
ncbi:hypothetical protein BGZ76_003115, partial [Entomortierella beljakovae]